MFEDRATGKAIVICALDNLGKGAAGQAVQNANLALGLEETAGLRLQGGAWCERHGCAGLRRQRCALRDPQDAERPRARSLDRARDRCGDVHRQPHAGGARRPLEAASRARAAAGGGRQLGERERGDRRAGHARRAGDRGGDGTAARAHRGAGARALDRRDRRAAAGRRAARRASAPRWTGLSPDGRAGGGRGDPDHRHLREGGRRARRGVRGRRDGEGLRDDPPQPRDDARRRHDRLPARAGRGARVPAPRRRAKLQRDLRRRRVLDQRHGRAARERRVGGRARRRSVRGGARRGLLEARRA